MPTHPPQKRDPLLDWKEACALVIVGGQPRGTAYLVTPHHAATCEHVVHEVAEGSPVKLKFGWGECLARVAKKPPQGDVALLELETPASVKPLVWDGALPERGAHWLAVGFPGVTATYPGANPTPIVVSGTVRDPHGVDDHDERVIQLFCEDFASGKGGLPHGLSGGPVLVQGKVVSHLKRIVTAPSGGAGVDARRSELGLVWATPLEDIVALLPEGDRTPKGPEVIHPPPGSPYSPVYHVARDADTRARDYASTNAPIWIQGGWRMGSSWCLAHLIDRSRAAASLKNELLTLVQVNLRDLHLAPDSSGDDFIEQLVEIIAHQIGGDPDKLRPRGRLMWALRLTYWLEAEALPRAGGRLVLSLEHFEVLAGHALEVDVCYTLRGWVEQRPLRPIWQIFEPIVVSTYSPATMTGGRGRGRSPVATPPVFLDDFTVEECESLARLYGVAWSRHEIEMHLRPWLGGHPFLNTIAVQHAAATSSSLASIAGHAERGDGPFEPALATWFDGLPSWAREALAAVLQSPHVRLPDDDWNRLRNAGTVGAAHGRLRIQYKILESYIRRQLGLPGRLEAEHEDGPQPIERHTT